MTPTFGDVQESLSTPETPPEAAEPSQDESDTKVEVPELPVFTTPVVSIPTPTVTKPEKPEKRTWDNFRIKRDCFRLFSTYYKNKFKTFNKRW